MLKRINIRTELSTLLNWYLLFPTVFYFLGSKIRFEVATFVVIYWGGAGGRYFRNISVVLLQYTSFHLQNSICLVLGEQCFH